MRELNVLIEKKKKINKNKETRKTEKDVQNYRELQISDNEDDKKSIFSVTERVESKVISSSSSEWKRCSDKLFVRCLSSSKNKIEKQINSYLDAFINTTLHCMSIGSRLIS